MSGRYTRGVGGLAPFNNDLTLPCRREDVPPDTWYPEAGGRGEAARKLARKLCTGCHRRAECLLWSLKVDETSFGIFAGLSPEERRVLRNRNPHRESDRERPVPPARETVQWGWARNGQPQPGYVANSVAAGRWFMAGHGTQAAAAARFKVNSRKVGEVAALLRYAPELIDVVENGWMPMERAYRYTAQVRDWQAAA